VRYVSTRGEAPPLGFVEAMLAGLARDGGLYVPVAWPRLDPPAIASFAGRPYAEVAVEVIRPFVGDAAIAEPDLARMAREAYGNFRHPPVAPLVQFGVSDFVLELFHGPTPAFKDLAMQLLSRLMDHALEARGERTTIVVATSGDTGGAAIEAFRGRARTDVFVLFPQGRISDVQRRMMTTVEDDNVHALAIDGTFDDCQAVVKGMFNHHAFRDQARLSGVNSINWARIVAQVVYYFTAAVALGSPDRKVAFTVPTGNFGDVYAGFVALRMGLPIDRLLVATNVNDILAPHRRDRSLRAARGGGDLLAVDGHPGGVEFRAPVVRRLWPRRAHGAQPDGLVRPVAALRAFGTRGLGGPRGILGRPGG
jgi:threonine synthase